MAALAETARPSPETLNICLSLTQTAPIRVLLPRRVPEYVTVDSFLPVNSSGNFVFALGGKSAANAGNELWVALAEKGFAQVDADWI